ncbi:MAG: hypothetical protein GOP50_12580 [Candidatus Heimdallarchaeota archaeon]|nr:hypothetical protein [Candidatus Heimdallarchaeota archaeon]
MKKKAVFILSLLGLSIFSFTMSTSLAEYEISYLDFTYSDNLSPGESVAWEIMKLEKEDLYEWEIKPGITMELGDILRVNITTDPDELNLTTFEEIHTTTEEWANFYKNDDYLGNDASALDWGGSLYPGTLLWGPVFWMYFVPVTLQNATASVDFFDFVVAHFEVFKFNDPGGSYDIEKKDNLLIISAEEHIDIPGGIFGGDYKFDSVMEISYNVEWGTLDKLEIAETIDSSAGKEKFELILLNTISTQSIPFNWAYGMIALFVIGLAYILRKKVH